MSDETVARRVPCAGCEQCGLAAWVLVLDEFPPNHTKITAFVCAGCKQIMPVNIDVNDMRDRSEWTEVHNDGGDVVR